VKEASFVAFCASRVATLSSGNSSLPSAEDYCFAPLHINDVPILTMNLQNALVAAHGRDDDLVWQEAPGMIHFLHANHSTTHCWLL
jgi:hypothetical protein